MAEETLLLVDDDAVSLKMTAAVLRSEGYRVHLYSTGEQALMALNTMSPDMILVDLQLPGMDGLELTRRVRAQQRMKEMLVVALTGSDSADTEAQAYEAGCDGFITKSIDKRTLARRLRAFFEGQDQPAAPMPVPHPSTAAAEPATQDIEIEGMRRSFLAEGTRTLRRMIDTVGNELDPSASARVFHQWIGSAGVLGYMEIAQRARAAETMLGRTSCTAAEVSEALTGLLRAFTSPKGAGETPIPDSILQELNRKRIGLVGFADEQADKVCAAFEKVRALSLLFGTDEPPDSESIRNCSVVMVHVRPETLHSAWLQPDGELPANLALVLAGAREHLMALDPKVQSHACEYLIDGWQPEEVVMRLSFAIARVARLREAAAAREAAGPATETKVEEAPRVPIEKPAIVIADDDEQVRAVVRSALQRLGMDCQVASNGPDALRLIREGSPHAAVLDVNMPGMDGFEILYTIRKDKLPVRVVMLTARQQEADVLRGFNLGADDYIVKPFNPLELAARLRRLL